MNINVRSNEEGWGKEARRPCLSLLGGGLLSHVRRGGEGRGGGGVSRRIMGNQTPLFISTIRHIMWAHPSPIIDEWSVWIAFYYLILHSSLLMPRRMKLIRNGWEWHLIASFGLSCGGVYLNVKCITRRIIETWDLFRFVCKSVLKVLLCSLGGFSTNVLMLADKNYMALFLNWYTILDCSVWLRLFNVHYDCPMCIKIVQCALGGTSYCDTGHSVFYTAAGNGINWKSAFVLFNVIRGVMHWRETDQLLKGRLALLYYNKIN